MANVTKSFFVDTNIFLYLRERPATKKSEVALSWVRGLADRKALVISPQVVNEFCNVMTTKLSHLTARDLRAAVADLGIWCTAQTRYENAVGALALREIMHVRFYDAVLLSSAMDAGCGVFLSEDLQHGRVIGDMTIINPFKADIDALLRPN